MICSFQCTNCSPRKGVPLPSLGLPGSGVRRMGSWKEWCIPPSPLPILSGFVQHRCPGPCSSLLAKSGVPCWEFLPGQSVVDTAVRVSPRTLTMPSMGPSAQDNLQMKDPLWMSRFPEWRNSEVRVVVCLFFILQALRAAPSTVEPTSQKCQVIFNLVQIVVNSSN